MKSTYLIALFILLSSSASVAQTYYFSLSSDTYSELTGSTSVTNGKVWDDPKATIPIGFNFTFFDTTVSTLFIDDWGYGAELTLDSSGTGAYGLLIPYGADLMDRGYKFNQGGAPTSLSTISYKVVGNAGNRVLKIEWENVGFYSEIEIDDESTDYANFQLWLFEGSNNLEIHFGPNSITQPDLCFDFETGTYIGLYPKYDFGLEEVVEAGQVLSGIPSAPTFNSTSDIYVDYMNGVIPDGMVYKFSKSAANIETNRTSLAQLNIAPNPSSNQILITLEDKKQQIKIVEIIDPMGKIVVTADNILNPINISELATGVYVVNVKTDTHTFSSRILKH